MLQLVLEIEQFSVGFVEILNFEEGFGNFKVLTVNAACMLHCGVVVHILLNLAPAVDYDHHTQLVDHI